MQSLLTSAISALGAFGGNMAMLADNIANINTPHYKSGRAYYETGPQGFGVRVGEISRDTSPGAPLPALPSDTFVPGTDAYVLAQSRQASNVQIEREFTNMIVTEHAYNANAKAIQLYEDISGAIVNLKV